MSTTDEVETGRTVVLEFGSSKIRAGFSGQDSPQLVMPTAVGRPRHPIAGQGDVTAKGQTGDVTATTVRGRKGVFVGEEAMSRRGELIIKRPVEWGVVTNWDELEVLWTAVLEDGLQCGGVSEEEEEVVNLPLVVVEGEVMTPRVNREKLTQLAFETFHVPLFFLAPAPPLALRATGRATGLVVDVAGSVVRVVPVYEGYALKHAVMKFDFGSDYLTDHLVSLLQERRSEAYEATSAFWREVAGMKEALAYVAQDYGQELATFGVSQEKQHVMLDGRLVTLGAERFQCAEPLFQPGLIGMERWGLAEHVVNTVASRCDVDVRETLLSNVVLTGGGSLLPGLASRLQEDVAQLLRDRSDALRKMHVQVVAPPGRDLLAWKGASLLPNSPAFADMCISSDEYDEYGPSLVYRKCF